jgi:hypothetical protein
MDLPGLPGTGWPGCSDLKPGVSNLELVGNYALTLKGALKIISGWLCDPSATSVNVGFFCTG